MSYILDALKKSDRERKRGDVPNLQTIHIPISTESQTPWILYGFISVLLLVLAFVIGMVIPDQEKQIATVMKQNELEVSNVIVKKPVKTGVELIKPSVSAGVVATLKNSEKSVPVGKNIASENVQLEVKKSAIPAVPVKSFKQHKNIHEIPYLSDMPDYLQASIPQMTFAGHVYSTNSANRSVIINGYSMSEGDTVVQGINVVEITSSGVVFSLHDELFKMDILQDWSFE